MKPPYPPNVLISLIPHPAQGLYILLIPTTTKCTFRAVLGSTKRTLKFLKKNIHSDSLSAMKFGLGEGMRYEN